ncbi:TIR domain-containing protein [filamentous cyanobacterium LEGE 11480]|uniref:TIR domain-containing protein n=1 Tax=Romeriopsis navalis LEGE 11480 TaxID=2777977 RepID=A0A928VQB2_9CYAN|nr:TIR domain-containing protein [Romeriopsis navalis]MBE9031838.1 TIR domain-containing protein [Romeriopsis navalis LEGE 11480]
MKDIFISYSRRDQEFVNKLNQAIEATGRDAWIDWQDIKPTVKWWQEIERGIEGANNFVFVISPDSIASSVCEKEIDHARQHNKRLVPIIYREGFVVDPASEAHAALNAHNWLLFREQDDFDKSFALLVESIEMDLDHVKAHTRLLQRSLEWIQERRDSFLLRGDDLLDAEIWEKEATTKAPKITPEQRKYIHQSRRAEDDENERKQILLNAKTQAEEKVQLAERRVKRGNGFLGLTVLALGIAAGTAIFTYRRWEEVQNYALIDRQLNQANQVFETSQLDGFIQAAVAARKAQAIMPDEFAKMNQEHWPLLGTLTRIFGEQREQQRLIGHRNVVNQSVFSPNGTILATASRDGIIKLWNVKTGKPIRTFPKQPGWRISMSIAFSPDGKILASNGGIRSGKSTSRIIQLWDVATGKSIRQLGKNLDTIYSLRFSPDGETLATAGYDKTIKLWNFKTGELLRKLEGHTGTIYSISFSPDGKTLASGSADKTIKIWNIETEKSEKTFKGHTGAIRGVAFRHDGKILASASQDSTAKLWNIKTGNLLRTITGHASGVRAVRFTPNGRNLLTASYDYTAKLWNVPLLDKKADFDQRATAVFEVTTLQGHVGPIYDANLSGDGQWLTTASIDGTARIWKVQGGLQSGKPPQHEKTITDLAFSQPDGRFFISVSSDRKLKIWDTKTRELLDSVKAHDGRITRAAFSPTQQLIATASTDKTIKLWQLNNDGTVQPLSTLEGHRDTIQSIEFSPDGKYIVSGSADSTAKLWDISSGKQIHTFEGHSLVISVNFSPDGQLIATGSDDETIRLWNAETFDAIATLKGHLGAIRSLKFSPDSKLLASGSGDRTIKVWNTQTQKLVRTLNGHRQAIYSIEFQPQRNRQLLVSAGADQRIIHWDLEAGEMIADFQAANHWILAAKYSPDGKLLASAGGDRIIRFISLDRLSHWISVSCRWLTPYLTNNPEKNSYDVPRAFGKIEKRKVCPELGSK